LDLLGGRKTLQQRIHVHIGIRRSGTKVGIRKNTWLKISIDNPKNYFMSQERGGERTQDECGRPDKVDRSAAIPKEMHISAIKNQRKRQPTQKTTNQGRGCAFRATFSEWT